jgi:hypothetical protein
MTVSEIRSVSLPPRRPLLRVRRRPRRDGRPLALVLTAVSGACMALAFTGSAARPVMLPLVSLLLLAVIYVAVMIRRDRRVPVFELGSMFVLAVTAYGAVPLMNYLAGGLEWQTYADPRLVNYAPSPEEVGAFAWQHVALLASFIVAYLWVRKASRPLSRTPLSIDRPTISAIVVIWLSLVVYFWVMAHFFGLSYDQSYANMSAGIGPGIGKNLPLIVQQVSHNLRGMLTLEKQLLLIILISSWSAIRNRVFVVLLLGFELSMILTRFYGRTELMIVLLTSVVLYDLFVRPLSIKLVVGTIAVALAAVVIYGAVRDAVVTQSLGGAPAAATMPSLDTNNNEFQVLWANAFDLHKRRELGTLEVPWQIYVSDLYNVIPSQFLPFEKLDPSLWYVDVIGDRSGIGFMFGILSQAALGWGWIELVVRGAFLGLILAGIHRWYAWHQRSFWLTALYAFILVWLFYSVRSTMLYWTYFVLYSFVPTMLATIGLALLLRRPFRLHARSRVS